MKRIEIGLNDRWQFLMDAEDRYASTLPNADQFGSQIGVEGSWEEQGFGVEPMLRQIDTWTPVRSYIGAAWYRQTFYLSEAEALDEWQLTVSGVRWSTELWVNGQYIGKQDSLSVAHRYDFLGCLVQGHNELLIRVDNRMVLPLSDSHIHTRHTATEWGGITGGVTLVKLPPLRIDEIVVTPDVANGAFRCVVRTAGKSAGGLGAGAVLTARCISPTGESYEASADVISGEVQLSIALGEQPVLWSDVNPQLYDAHIVLHSADQGLELDHYHCRVGLRMFEACGKQLKLNGNPVFLRGYVDCCIFPLTGYPLWDKAHYRQQFQLVRSYGFNHVRLHGWNAPKPFWEAADEAGMLVQTELPHWSAHYRPRGAVPHEGVDRFLEQEIRRIYRELSHHSSFVMFSLGNELIEDDGHERLNELVRLARSLDSTRLVTDNTGFGQLPEQDREGDFYIHSFNWHKPLKTEEIALPETNRDFSALTRLTGKPVVGHEHAQFAMYVRPQEKEKYTGVLQPTWLETTEETLRHKGLLGRIEEFVEATGIHQVRALKEAMERVRRTPQAAGVQLLDIRDFPGQGHATTGLLDVFWDSKGLIEADRVYDFNGATVLLMGCDERTWFAGQSIDIRVLISHYGEEKELSGQVGWQLVGRQGVWAEGAMQVNGHPRGCVREAGAIHLIAPDGKAQQWTLEAWWEAGDAGGSPPQERQIRNAWSFWSYPRVTPFTQAPAVWSSIPALNTALYGVVIEPNQRFDAAIYPRERGTRLVIVERLTTNVLQYLINGGQVWIMAGSSELYDVVTTKHLPVFWNYLMFSEQAGGTMGTIIHDHPALGTFPHDGRSDWQWYHLFNGAPAICLDTVPEVAPIVECIDNFNRAKKLAYLFEANVGRGKLFVSSLAMHAPEDWKRPETAHLFREMLGYLFSEQFCPSGTMTVGQVLGLFRLRGIHSFL